MRETPMPSTDLSTILDEIERARKIVGGLCAEGRHPRMSIPVQHDDEDRVLVRVLDGCERAIHALQAAEARLSAGHNDTCGSALLMDGNCSCGHDALLDALASLKAQ